MQVGDFECTKYKDLVNAHLPIPELNRYVAMKIFLVCNSVEGIVLQETWHVLVLMMLKTLFNKNMICLGFDDVEDVVQQEGGERALQQVWQ